MILSNRIPNTAKGNSYRAVLGFPRATTRYTNELKSPNCHQSLEVGTTLAFAKRLSTNDPSEIFSRSTTEVQLNKHRQGRSQFNL